MQALGEEKDFGAGPALPAASLAAPIILANSSLDAPEHLALAT